MKIQMKLSVFIGAMLLMLGVLMVAIGTGVINTIIYGLNTENLSLKLAARVEKIEAAITLIEESGATGIIGYVQQAQTESLQQLQTETADQTAAYFVIAAKEQQILFHSKMISGQANTDQILSDDIIQAMISQQSGTLNYDYAGVSYFSVYRYIDTWDWLIGVSLPTTTMFRQRQTYLVTVGWTALVVFVGLLTLSYVMGRRIIVKPVVEMVKVANAIAAGDLDQTIQIRQRDEIGMLMHALNGMIQHVKPVVMGVRDTANTIAAASQQLSSSSEQLSNGASQQAASMEESSSSMEEMAANIRQNAENARQTGEIALQSAEYAEEGGQVVTETFVAMQQIAQKIAIIEDIATQTRMLSLNATIEASRAQEHGKAFSVVASEVRQLSTITKKAAEEIKQLASTSLEVSEKAETMLSTLVPSIRKTTELIQEISAASHEQITSAEHINRAIQQVDRVTQQNAAIAEETAAAAGQLSNQARQLQDTIAFFTIEESS